MAGSAILANNPRASSGGRDMALKLAAAVTERPVYDLRIGHEKHEKHKKQIMPIMH
jgi:hypothetical protein